MKYPRIKLGFASLSNSALLNLGRNVVSQMTTNHTMFTEEILKMKDELKVSCDEFRMLIDKANGGSNLDRGLRNNQKKKLVVQMTGFAKVLNGLYAGDSIMMDATGFEILQNKGSLNLGDISKLDLSSSTTKGKISVEVIGAKYMKSMAVEYMIETKDVDVWEWKLFSGKRAELGPFETGTVVHVRVTALGKNNETKRSEIYKIGVS